MKLRARLRHRWRNLPAHNLFAPALMTRLLLAAFVSLASLAHAAYPTFSTTKPNGGQRGTELQLVVTGTQLADFEDFLFMSPGFSTKKIEKVEEKKVTATIAIAADVPLGNHLLRLRTKTGVSHARQFFVGQYPNVDEKEPNDAFESPQVVTFNQTVEGVVQNEDVDYYKVSAKKGQRIAVEIDGLRLGYLNFDPYVAILDKERFELGASDDTILHRQDGYVSVVAPEDGDYWIKVHESSYRGSANSYYRLHVGSFNRPDVVYPAGGKIGTVVKTKFIEKSGETFEEDVQVPTQADPTYMLLPKSKDSPPSGNPFRVVAFDNTLEAEPNEDQAKATPSAGDPIALNGVIGTPGDVDYFKLPLKKGQSIVMQTFAQALGSPLDSVVNVYNAKGGSLSGNDDGGGRRRLDSKFTVAIPADGDYFVRVTDHLERGGPAYVYRIELAASEPSVKFSSPNYSVNDSHLRQFIAVPRGGYYATMVNVTRSNVSADMTFDMPNLPKGVELVTKELSKDLPNINLLFKAAADAPIAGSVLPITLKANDPKINVVGTLAQEFDIVRNGNVIYYTDIEEKLPVVVVDEAPYSLEIVKPTVPLVVNGVLTMKVVAKRKEGFNAAIRVLIMWKPPGISCLGEQTIAEGKTECEFVLDANANVPAGNWNFTVLGEAEVGGGKMYNASPFCEISTGPAHLSGTMALTAVEQGQSTEMVCKLESLLPFEGEAVARIVGIPDSIQVATTKVKKDTKEAIFKVTTTDKSPVGKQANLFVAVDVPIPGGTTTHRVATGSVLRLDAPRKAPAPKPAATVAAATKKVEPAKPAEPKRLTRLEQLRLDAAQQK
jgi:hypothetical protein